MSTADQIDDYDEEDMPLNRKLTSSIVLLPNSSTVGSAKSKVRWPKADAVNHGPSVRSRMFNSSVEMMTLKPLNAATRIPTVITGSKDSFDWL